MKCPHNYDCFYCPEGDGFECDYELSQEEIQSIEKSSQDSYKYVGSLDAKRMKSHESKKDRRSYLNAYYQAHKEELKVKRELKKREKAKQRALEYYYAHKDEVAEKRKARYAADPQKEIENVRKWQSENPDKVRQYSREYQQRKRNNLTDLGYNPYQE